MLNTKIIFQFCFVLISITLFASCDSSNTNEKVKECQCSELDLGEDGFVYLNSQVFTGVCKSFWEEGIPEAVIPFTDGKIHGIRRTYWENGNLEEELTFEHGTMEGEVKAYYPNGGLKFKGQNKNDYPHGNWIAFFETSEKKMEYSLVNGVEQDSIINYYKDGTIKSKGYFIDGLKEGEWLYYDEKGNLVGSRTFKQDKEQ